METSEFIQGNKPVDARINVRREIRKMRANPVMPLIKKLPRPKHWHVLHDEVARFELAYEFYRLSYARLLPEIALALRWTNGPYWAWKNRRRYTTSEKRIADAYAEVADFLPLDFWSYLLYARILCDRTASLARYFLHGNPLPSFTSFADHRAFFERDLSPGKDFDDYGPGLLSRTKWFVMPLKEVRDKYLVHAGPRHMRFFGTSNDKDYELILVRPTGDNSSRPMEHTNHITVSARRLALDINAFLRWFNKYGVTKVTGRGKATHAP